MSKQLTFIDLFAGVGGFRQGLKDLDFNCMYSCEIDKNCEVTYKANFGIGFDEYDIRSLQPDYVPYADLICAGFPCQPFSIAGKGEGLLDPRSDVFFKITELASRIKPKAIFLENVPNLAKHQDAFSLILRELDLIGYDVYYKVLDSAKFGIPQSRKRLYITAFRKDLGLLGFKFTECTSKQVSVRSALIRGDYSIPISDRWQQYIDLYTGKVGIEDLDFEPPKTRRSPERIDPDANLEDCILQMRSSGIRVLSIDKPLPTLAVSVSGGGAMIPIYSKERRHLSVREMARIMGFADEFHFPVARTHAIKQLANAVCPPVIESIGKDILFALRSVGA